MTITARPAGITHTVQIETRPGEREIYAAVEAARAAGATHYVILAPHPAGGYYHAAAGRVAQPMRPLAQAAAISGPDNHDW